jgi:hypothetical protein
VRRLDPPAPALAGAGVTSPPVEGRRGGNRKGMFVFFSNRLGCAGSLLLSIAVTLVLIAILTLVD